MKNQQINESEICKTLKEKLKSIWNNADFIRGVPDILKTDTNIIKMNNFLDKGLRDTDKITLLALSIQRGLV